MADFKSTDDGKNVVTRPVGGGHHPMMLRSSGGRNLTRDEIASAVAYSSEEIWSEILAEETIKVSRRVLSSAASDGSSARTQQLEEKVAALEEQMRRSAAVLPSDFSKDSDRVAGLNSTPPSDVSEDSASEQANLDGLMEFSINYTS